MRRLLVGGLATMLVLAACGGSHEGHGAGGAEAAAEGGGAHGAGMDFGAAAPASEATTTIEVTALDSLAFDPATVRVEAGEVVTFVVSNPGKAPHEFVLGDEQYQEEHERMMQDGHEMEHGDNALELAPGETAELTWRFEEEGEVLFACHVAGHYDGGMFGGITVT